MKFSITRFGDEGIHGGAGVGTAVNTIPVCSSGGMYIRDIGDVRVGAADGINM